MREGWPRELSRRPDSSNLASPFTLHPSPFTLHPSPFTLHPSPFTLHPSPFTLHPSPFTLHPSPFTIRPTSLTTRFNCVGSLATPKTYRSGRTTTAQQACCAIQSANSDSVSTKT